MFPGKGVLKICSKLTAEHPCWNVISIKLQSNKITLQHGCSPVNLLYIFRIPFYEYTYWGLLLFPAKMILWNRHNRLIHLLSPKFSIPNSWYIFSRKEITYCATNCQCGVVLSRFKFNGIFNVNLNKDVFEMLSVQLLNYWNWDLGDC